jgi:uncharacterized membrane protein
MTAGDKALVLSQHTPPPLQTRTRSIAKSISWRIVGSLDTFVLSSAISHQIEVGAVIAGSEVLTKLALYYLHERGWARIRWGMLGRVIDDRFVPIAPEPAPNAMTSRGG